MIFKDLSVGANFVDADFGSIWKKESDSTALKAVEDDNAYLVGQWAEFQPNEIVTPCGRDPKTFDDL